MSTVTKADKSRRLPALRVFAMEEKSSAVVLTEHDLAELEAAHDKVVAWEAAIKFDPNWGDC